MLGALCSGIFPRITEWHDDSPIAREVFVNIPDPLYWAFYATVPIMLFMVAYLTSLRFRNYERGAPDDRRTTKKNAERRLRDFRSRRLDADAAARPRGRDHALVHLLRLHLLVHRHGAAGDRPPAPRVD